MYYQDSSKSHQICILVAEKTTLAVVLYISILFVMIVCQLDLKNYGSSCTDELDRIGRLFGRKNVDKNGANHENVISATRSNRFSAEYGYHKSGLRHGSLRHQDSGQRKARAVYLASLSNNSNYQGNYRAEQASHNDQPPILSHCCACDEAKYELVFEGLWSRYTHPGDFPTEVSSVFFSDIIGASHSIEFKMWDNDTFASEGVKDLAETGSTRRLESELKRGSHQTRTIIKARELRDDTLNSKTTAVFRTDRQHHLVSVLSKLGPSPDWMVGVSSLELCQSDCTWAPQRVLNLGLWDAGTDSGNTFTAPDSPTRPQETIHPARKMATNQQTYPNNRNHATRSPSQPYSAISYDPASYYQQSNDMVDQSAMSNNYEAPPVDSLSTEPSKPYARLTVTRQRIYEKSCDRSQTESYPTTPTKIIDPDTSIRPKPTAKSLVDCRFTEWSDWSSCTSTCGRGIRSRTRAFLNDQAYLNGCSEDMIDKEVCISECTGNTTCVTSDWSEWSRCSVSCGQGYSKRIRHLVGPRKKACDSIQLTQMSPCSGNSGTNATCSTDQPENPFCQVTKWSEWSECSASCGKGIRTRTRRYLSKDNIEGCKVKLIQKQSCTGDCLELNRVSIGEPVDCKLSPWSQWSSCSSLCGEAHRVRSRRIIQFPLNGGKPCDKKLHKRTKCKNLPPCPPGYQQVNDDALMPHEASNHLKKSNRHHNHSSNGTITITTTTTTQPTTSFGDDEDTDGEELEVPIVRPCEYGDWTQWSECEVVCQPVRKGSNKLRQRHPLDPKDNQCPVIEELYYCDPNIYC